MAKPKGTPRFNPRSGDRRGKAPVGQRPSPSVWYGLAFVLVLVLVQTYYLTAPGQTIPYSEFKTLLKNGELVEVTVGDQPTIHGSQGSVYWLPGTLTHTVNNRTKAPIEVIVVRIKDQPGK